jgi:hypothetical protein
VAVTFDHVIPNNLLIEWNQSMTREVQPIWVQGESVSMIQQKIQLDTFGIDPVVLVCLPGYLRSSYPSLRSDFM